MAFKNIPTSALERKVFVYFNLHNKLWSVRDVKTGLVLGHAKVVKLYDVSFKVSQAGRARVIREQKKYVHAGTAGNLIGWIDADVEVDTSDYQVPAHAMLVRYNPYKYTSFVYNNPSTAERDVRIDTSGWVILGLNRSVWGY